MDTMMTTSEILNTGMTCLKEKLGIVGAEQFISVIIREQFDYTKWQREHFDAKGSEQISQEARAFAEKNPHSGKAKIIL